RDHPPRDVPLQRRAPPDGVNWQRAALRLSLPCLSCRVRGAGETRCRAGLPVVRQRRSRAPALPIVVLGAVGRAEPGRAARRTEAEERAAARPGRLPGGEGEEAPRRLMRAAANPSRRNATRAAMSGHAGPLNRDDRDGMSFDRSTAMETLLQDLRFALR